MRLSKFLLACSVSVCVFLGMGYAPCLMGYSRIAGWVEFDELSWISCDFNEGGRTDGPDSLFIDHAYDEYQGLSVLLEYLIVWLVLVGLPMVLLAVVLTFVEGRFRASPRKSFIFLVGVSLFLTASVSSIGIKNSVRVSDSVVTGECDESFKCTRYDDSI